MKKLLLFITLVCIATAFLYAKALVTTPIPVSDDIIFQVNKGDNLLKIARALEDNHLISRKWSFILYAKLKRFYPQIKAGEYLVTEPVSLVDIENLLTSGKVFHRKITLPEGLTARGINAILAENEFLSGEAAEFKDGEVLPETYTFSRGDSRQSIVDQGKKALKETLEKAWNERDDDLPLKSKEELLIMASIVEKETGVPEERPQVASVFINRLRLGMLLQTDPTVIYAITQGKEELNRPIYRKDLEIDSPYNTYKYAGLPPSPICNPGKEAIFAVAHPDKTPYLYFVASGTGGHNFAKSLAEHNENVRKWRNLNK